MHFLNSQLGVRYIAYVTAETYFIIYIYIYIWKLNIKLKYIWTNIGIEVSRRLLQNLNLILCLGKCLSHAHYIQDTIYSASKKKK